MKKLYNRSSKKRILKTIVITLLFLTAIACDKDSEPDFDKATISFNPKTPEGNNIIFTYAYGKSKSLLAGEVYGWVTYDFPGTEKFRQSLGIDDENSRFIIQFNLPEGTKEEDVVSRKHKLNPIRFVKDKISQLNDIYPEIFFAYGDVNGKYNATGTVEIVKTNSYDIIGYVKGEIIDKDDQLLKFEGHFWSDEVTPWINNKR